MVLVSLKGLDLNLLTVSELGNYRLWPATTWGVTLWWSLLNKQRKQMAKQMTYQYCDLLTQSMVQHTSSIFAPREDCMCVRACMCARDVGNHVYITIFQNPSSKISLCVRVILQEEGN